MSDSNSVNDSKNETKLKADNLSEEITEGSEGEDIVDDIYDPPAEHSVISDREFKKWHHPRKHWVRINQLSALAQKLISESHLRGIL